MLYPNKHTQFEESIIFKMLHILDYNLKDETNINELYLKVKHKYNNIDEFIYSIDLLYVLDVIEIDFNTETISYVNRN